MALDPYVWMMCCDLRCRILGGMCRPESHLGGLVPDDNYQLEIGCCRSLVPGDDFDMNCNPDYARRLFLGFLNDGLDGNYHLERESSSLHGRVANSHLVVQLDDSYLQVGSC